MRPEDRRQFADFNLADLYAALDAQRQQRGLTWSQAMREINLSIAAAGMRPIAQSTVSGLRTKPVGEGDGILQMLRWLKRAPESFVPGFEPSAQHALPDAPDDRILRFDTVKLHAALDAARVARGFTWQQVSRELPGTSAGSLMHLKKGGRTGFPHVARMARWLDQPVASFVRLTRR